MKNYRMFPAEREFVEPETDQRIAGYVMQSRKWQAVRKINSFMQDWFKIVTIPSKKYI